MGRITIKRNLSQSDWLTLAPLAAALIVWIIVKGVRYVPN